MADLNELIDDRGLIAVTTQINAVRPQSRPVTHQAVRKWANSGIPAARVIQLAVAFPGYFTLHSLRPDLYPVGDWCVPGDYVWPDAA